ncbi:hypothetical protein [Candidatus Uabimicrobium sp. HlEnr_7]|uniref:hypothetical protein n=1 Tax=Candidatus Uabimicrobium helgolandensis TaxID=3095367 RepID=UPI003556E94A
MCQTFFAENLEKKNQQFILKKLKKQALSFGFSLEELKTQLPKPEQIAKLLKGIEKEKKITNQKSLEYNNRLLLKV